MVEFGQKQSELEKWFPRDTSSATEPLIDLSSSHIKLQSLKDKLYASPQWKAFQHFNYGARTIRLDLSTLTEKAIPWIHRVLEDDDFNFDANSVPSLERKDLKSAIMGNVLHEALSLFDLWRYAKLTNEQIDKSFPTQRADLILPFIDAMKKVNLGIKEVWSEFHSDQRLVDRQNYLLSEEFGELPLSSEKQNEIEMRASSEVFDTGLKLAESLALDTDPSITHSSEALGIFNFDQLSIYGNSRIQIPVRFDEILLEKTGKHRIRYNFFDLKTGKRKDTWPQQIQYLLMEFLAGHFIDQFIKDDEIPNMGKGLISPRIKNTMPSNNEYTFEYGFFDQIKGKLSRIPIVVNYNNASGELFLEWLAFYSDAACALKVPLKDYIKNNTPFNNDLLSHSQSELTLPTRNGGTIYNSHHVSEGQKKKNEYKGPYYLEGKSESEVICETCGKHMTQFVDRVTNLNGKKIDFWVQLYCSGHGNSSEWIRKIDSEALIRKK